MVNVVLPPGVTAPVCDSVLSEVATGSYRSRSFVADR